jgi:hypothetical protein
MTFYSPYNNYSTQIQHYNPYSYASYYSTPYEGMKGKKRIRKIEL